MVLDFLKRVKNVQEEPAEAVHYIERLEASEKQLKKLTKSVEKVIEAWSAIGVYGMLRVPTPLAMAFIEMKEAAEMELKR